MKSTWNRTVDNAHDARAAGAKWAPTLGELVNDSEVVISFLLDNEAVERVYLGTNGLLTGRVEGRLFVDMSTVSPGTHARIAPAMAARNASFIECPVSGSIPAARSGALVGFVGGEVSSFARARPSLEQLCRRVEHVGPLGAGARMKLAANLLLAVFWQALGEALLLVDPSAADAALVIDLLADSNIGAAVLRARAPQVVAAMNGKTSGAAAFDVDSHGWTCATLLGATARGDSLPLAIRTLSVSDCASREEAAVWIAWLIPRIGSPSRRLLPGWPRVAQYQPERPPARRSESAVKFVRADGYEWRLT
jgi:3-hydroxyisobutyrate dehydrogenase